MKLLGKLFNIFKKKEDEGIPQFASNAMRLKLLDMKAASSGRPFSVKVVPHSFDIRSGGIYTIEIGLHRFSHNVYKDKYGALTTSPYKSPGGKLAKYASREEAIDDAKKVKSMLEEEYQSRLKEERFILENQPVEV